MAAAETRGRGVAYHKDVGLGKGKKEISVSCAKYLASKGEHQCPRHGSSPLEIENALCETKEKENRQHNVMEERERRRTVRTARKD